MIAARIAGRVTFLPALVLVAGFIVHAQAPAPKPIALDDYPKFKRVSGAAISANGKWMLYTLTPNGADGTLVVRALDGDKVYEAPRGTNATFPKTVAGSRI